MDLRTDLRRELDRLERTLGPYDPKTLLVRSNLAIRLLLPACVEIHRHRGTVDGAEQGLVCTIDHDAVMGMHPDVAPAATRIVR